VLNLAGSDLILRNPAGFSRVGIDQRRRSSADLAGAARSHHHITVIAVESIHQLHRLCTSVFYIAVGEETSQNVARILLIFSSMLDFRHFSDVSRYRLSSDDSGFPERLQRSPRITACNWSTDCSRRSLTRI